MSFGFKDTSPSLLLWLLLHLCSHNVSARAEDGWLTSDGWIIMSTWIFIAFSEGGCFLQEIACDTKIFWSSLFPDVIYVSCFHSFHLFSFHTSDQQDRLFSVVHKSVYILISGDFSIHKIDDQMHFPKNWHLGQLPLLLSDLHPWAGYTAAGLNFWLTATLEQSILWTNLVLYPLLAVVNWGREASDLTSDTEVYVRRWWGAERRGMLQSMGSQRIGHDLLTEKLQ